MTIEINLAFCNGGRICTNKVLFYTIGLESSIQTETQMFTKLASYIRKKLLSNNEVSDNLKDEKVKEIIINFLPQQYFSKLEKPTLEEKIKKFFSKELNYIQEYKDSGYKLIEYKENKVIVLSESLQYRLINITTKTKLELNILDKWQKENSILYVANLYTFRDIADDDIKIFWKFISEAINETNTDKEFRILNLSLFKNLVVRKTDINNNQQLSVNFQQGKYNEYSCSYCEYSVLCKTLACDREKSEIEENE